MSASFVVKNDAFEAYLNKLLGKIYIAAYAYSSISIGQYK